ncbi:MAG: hypothetical protein ACRDE2_00025 [Chitinophagaceae bacterium]
MTGKIKKMIFEGLTNLSREVNVDVENVQFLINLSDDPDDPLLYSLMINLKVFRKLDFWETIGRKDKIKFIDYKSIATNSILATMDGYIRAGGVDKKNLFIILWKKNNDLDIFIFDGSKRIDAFPIEEMLN